MEKISEMIKYVYKYSESVGFDYEKTKELCKTLGISAQNYNGMIDRYLKNSLGLKDKDFLDKKDEIVKKRLIGYKLSLLVMPKSINIKDKTEYLKYLYDYSKKYDFDYEICNNFCKKIGISKDQYISHLKMYYLCILELSDEEIEVRIAEIITKRNNSKSLAHLEIPKELHITDKREYITYIYNFSVSVNFNILKCSELCEKLGINNYQYINIIKSYLSIIKNMSKDEIDKKIEEIMIKRQQTRGINYRKMNINNPVLLEHGIETNYLWRTIEEKQIMAKYVFDYCQKNYTLYKKCSELSAMFKVSYTQIMNLYLYYLEQIKEINKEEYDAIIRQNFKNFQQESANNKRVSVEDSEKFHILLEIKNAKSFEEVISIMEKYNKKSAELKGSILSFSNSFLNEEEKVYEDLNQKLDKYSEYYKQKISKKKKEAFELVLEKRNNNIIISNAELAKKFIESELTLNEFCVSNNISLILLKKQVESIKEYNEELYNNCIQKINYYLTIEEKEYKEKLDELLMYLRNGISDSNGILRKFDVIDFYTLMNYDLTKLTYYSKKFFEGSDAKEVIIFCANALSQKENKKYENEIMKTTIEVNMQKDEKGMPIPGTGIILSDELKNKFIDFIRYYSIPLNDKNFRLVVKKYFKNEIELPEKENTRKIEQ